jgi:hypothetical protein
LQANKSLFNSQQFAKWFCSQNIKFVKYGIQKLWYLPPCMSSMTKGIIILPSSTPPQRYWYPKDLVIISKLYIHFEFHFTQHFQKKFLWSLQHIFLSNK